MSKAILFKTDGTTMEVQPKNGNDFSLEELNDFVGGHIEIVTLRNNFMVVNEEGKLNRLPVNHNATTMFQSEYGETDYIVGNALVCAHSMIE